MSDFSSSLGSTGFSIAATLVFFWPDDSCLLRPLFSTPFLAWFGGGDCMDSWLVRGEFSRARLWWKVTLVRA